MFEIIEKFKDTNICVVGDVMLDRYVFGEVERISPEAPIPIIKIEKVRETLGGAANVANNIVSLGGNVTLISRIGSDRNGKKIKKMCEKAGINTYFYQSSYPTIVKTRYIGKGQQMLRVDKEKTIEEKFNYKKIENYFKQSNLIVVSDYAKGFVGKSLILLLKKYKEKCIVDTKPQKFDFFKGFKYIKPNWLEAVQYCKLKGINVSTQNQDNNAEIICKILKRFLGSNILLSRGNCGLSVAFDRKIVHFPSTASEVVDVSGAGDTLVATFALCLSSGVDPITAANIANKAAGIEVSKLGTSVVYPEELLLSFGESKILTDYKKLSSLVRVLKRANKKIVLTNGVFDILHPEHVKSLEFAKGLGDVLIVGVNSDSSVKEIKGEKRPIMNEKWRAYLVASLKPVDYVFIFNEKSPSEKLVKIVKPDIYVKGQDWRNRKSKTAEFVKSYGGKVFYAPTNTNISTTKIIEEILSKYREEKEER